MTLTLDMNEGDLTVATTAMANAVTGLQSQVKTWFTNNPVPTRAFGELGKPFADRAQELQGQLNTTLTELIAAVNRFTQDLGIARHAMNTMNTTVAASYQRLGAGLGADPNLL